MNNRLAITLLLSSLVFAEPERRGRHRRCSTHEDECEASLNVFYDYDHEGSRPDCGDDSLCGYEYEYSYNLRRVNPAMNGSDFTYFSAGPFVANDGYISVDQSGRLFIDSNPLTLWVPP